MNQPFISTINTQYASIFNQLFETNTSQNYTYDEYARIESVTESIEGDDYTYAYTYDLFGRVKDLDYPGEFSIRYKYNDKGILIGVDDQNTGNLITRSDKLAMSGTSISESFEYDELDRLTKYKVGSNPEIVIDYNNDGSGRYNAKTDLGTFHYGESGAPEYYIPGLTGETAIFTKENNEALEKFYIHKDYLGSYQTITDENGAIVETLSFDPWGRRRNANDWTFANIPGSFKFDRGFTGHEHLDVFDLINMNGRVFDPLTTQFLSPDKLVQEATRSQNFNRYTYCLNNPLKYTDPSGWEWGDNTRYGNYVGGTGGFHTLNEYMTYHCTARLALSFGFYGNTNFITVVT
ncbi:MAG: hypothetical protein JW801_18550 [Bacteroidales bacterium]|nr:hypothetical protein [Bacteroidales bacterium]